MEKSAETGESLLGQNLTERYQLTGVLAEGPRSTVYCAKQLDLGRDVAVKVLALRADEHPELGQRLASTVQRSAKVRHPGVAEVYEQGVSSTGLYFVAMELLNGTSLRRILKQQGKFDPGVAVEIGAAIASALGALHAQGIVHTNLSPEGVFVVPNSGGGHDVKLVGAGMALPLATSELEKDPSARVTMRGLGGARAGAIPKVIYGSPETLCPEIAFGREPDARSDVYSLGVLVYWMLAGGPPFPESTWESLVARHIAERPQPLSERVEGVPDELERVVMRALEKDPAERFPSAAEFSSALWCALVPQARAASSTRRVWIIGGAVACALLVAAGAWWARSSRPAVEDPIVGQQSPTTALAPTVVSSAAPATATSADAPARAAVEPAASEPPTKKTMSSKKQGVPTPASASVDEPPPSYKLDDDLKSYKP